MDNLKLPAYPLGKDVPQDEFSGFTKLEKASLMIAQGLATRELFEMLETKNYPAGIAKLSVVIAKAVLEEANK